MSNVEPIQTNLKELILELNHSLLLPPPNSKSQVPIFATTFQIPITIQHPNIDRYNHQITRSNHQFLPKT